ncbi:ABC-2 type transport system ATP-binding protein [Plasticicumulans lactativorans]|uniref:ABC-2 type transport system ATP-binding protein n=1 Tax=Plasticicumulans lactativorans TaxID=1133106 RepID=A0A4R2LLV4_9GAMM|nr:ABC transporter ATP-binding protein [Plasticicumulans lactativorans]TCO80415.1 ABC-2 type transport system ATP-binding protein [Plasticicumulans lactativorans]
MGDILEVHDLVKEYPGLRAVDGVSFSIAPGTCFGLLGPNGAGKTTTIEMLEGIKTPSAGRILYRGEPLGARFRREAGIMFQSTALQDFLTVRECLCFFGALYPRQVPFDELVHTCALGEFLDRDNRKLSGGQRQRLLLAIALVNDPELVFLDEPTTGLDPQARRNFWALIESIKARGKTVVLTTHYMEEAYQLCDAIAIMDRGRIIARGTPDALLAAHFDDRILQLPREDLAGRGLPAGFAVFERRESVEISTRDVDAALAALLAAGVPLARLSVRSRTLEDLFLELTGRELRA